MKSIQERVRAQLAAQEKARKAAEYKAGESERRSMGARVAADVRREKRFDAIYHGDTEPRTRAELALLMRMELGE